MEIKTSLSPHPSRIGTIWGIFIWLQIGYLHKFNNASCIESENRNTHCCRDFDGNIIPEDLSENYGTKVDLKYAPEALRKMAWHHK